MIVRIRPWLGHVFAVIALVCAAVMVATLALALFGDLDRTTLFMVVTVTLSCMLAAAAFSGLAFTLWMTKLDRREYGYRHALRPVDTTKSS